MGAAGTKDAITLLRDDHRTVEDLFKQYEKATSDDRKRELATEICLELSVHSDIEEELFYPACEGKVDEELLKESVVEHDGAKVLIAEIMAGSPADEFFDSKVKVLQEQIEHHIEEEEQPKKGLFAQARDADIDLSSLAEKLAERKQELMQRYRDNLPTPEPTTLTEVSL